MANDAYGSWQARRDILHDLFEPLHVELAQLEDSEIVSTLVRSVTSHPGTGWAQVDAEINELRRHFAMARTDQDYRNIGNDCVAVLERLSATVFDADRHVKRARPPRPWLTPSSDWAYSLSTPLRVRRTQRSERSPAPSLSWYRQ
ncbi:MAG: hypothetical protein OXD34_05825 [bacterium]|nr:hypothetical protein [bacterium]